ncbi:MAG: YqgE/AlgH family protein [Bacteroidota bacterium]
MTKRFLEPSTGRMLLSEPALQDYYFARSVVLLVEHSEVDGTVGLILNKPVNLKLNEVVKDFPKVDFPLYLGGPVHPDRLFYIHTLGDAIPGSSEVFKGVYWGGDINALMKLIETKSISNSEVRFFIGYSGWNPGQLDSELSEKSWIVSQINKSSVMGLKPERLWGNLLKKMGNEYAIWSNYPLDPILN